MTESNTKRDKERGIKKETEQTQTQTEGERERDRTDIDADRGWVSERERK